MLRTVVLLLCAVAVASAAAPRAPGAAVRDLPFFYDLYTFRGDRPGTTAVVASFAVRAGELEREKHDGDERYRFDVTLVLSDTARGTVSRTDDSVFVRVPRRLSSDHLLHTHIETRVRPSRSTVQRVIMTDATTPGIGRLYGAVFPIPDYSGDALMLSDIALGQPGERAGWRRGDVTLALLPTSQFPESAFDVYYEVYNLPAGTRYGTVITVERVGGGDEERRNEAPQAVHIRFSGESAARADGTLPELRRVRASLPRGRYRLTVAVTDESSGETARRSRTFEVRGWEHSTTMVSALPIRPRSGR